MGPTERFDVRAKVPPARAAGSAGRAVHVYGKSLQPGGLLRYGIADLKLEKTVVARRIAQMQAEGVTIRTNVLIGALHDGTKVTNWAKETITPEQLKQQFDAVLAAARDGAPWALERIFTALAPTVTGYLRVQGSAEPEDPEEAGASDRAIVHGHKL